MNDNPMAKLIRDENDDKSNTNAKHLLLTGKPNINSYEHLETPLQTKFYTMQTENAEMLKTGLILEELKPFHQQYMSRVKELIDLNKKLENDEKQEKKEVTWLKNKPIDPIIVAERSDTSSEQSSSQSEKIIP